MPKAYTAGLVHGYCSNAAQLIREGQPKLGCMVLNELLMRACRPNMTTHRELWTYYHNIGKAKALQNVRVQ